MRLSQLVGERYREKPADASLISHVYLVKGGYIRYVGNGIYTLLPPARRISRKIENILREEMDDLGAQEVLFPVTMPATVWEASGRYEAVGKELLRFEDRSGSKMVLGMTHEECAVMLVDSDAQSYSKYPFAIYQIQTKFRDEARSRGGLIRVREFTMKDAYSFHRTQEDLENWYDRFYHAYNRIYNRVGLPEVISVKSDTGMMGGSLAHEYMLLCDAGEDSIAVCSHCDYRANVEAAKTVYTHSNVEEETIQKIHTPDAKTIEAAAAAGEVPLTQTLKACVFSLAHDEKPVVVFIRGDYEVNEAKLRVLMKDDILPFTSKDTDLTLGFLGPVGLDTASYHVVYDESLKGEKNLMVGANEVDYHLLHVSMVRDLPEIIYEDVAKVHDGDTCPVCGEKLEIHRGVEVGNIFQLGDKYTRSMNATYTDENGDQQYPLMGCYGIGVGRLLACAIEAKHDEYGPIWPYSIAPWQVHICAVNRKKEGVTEISEKLYGTLSEKYETILDDRDVQAGVAFSDADLLGVPIRVIVSPRNLEQGLVEIVTRDKTLKEMVSIEQVEETIAKMAKILEDKCKA